jgi:hypothetical protein
MFFAGSLVYLAASGGTGRQTSCHCRASVELRNDWCDSSADCRHKRAFVRGRSRVLSHLPSCHLWVRKPGQQIPPLFAVLSQVCMGSYRSQCAVMPIYIEMNDRRKFKEVLRFCLVWSRCPKLAFATCSQALIPAISFCTCVYIVAGVAAYICYGDKTAGVMWCECCRPSQCLFCFRLRCACLWVPL